MREQANYSFYYLSSKRLKELYKQTFWLSFHLTQWSKVVFFSMFNLSTGNVIGANASHYCVSGATRTTACCMNASMMAFVPKKDPKVRTVRLKYF